MVNHAIRGVRRWGMLVAAAVGMLSPPAARAQGAPPGAIAGPEDALIRAVGLDQKLNAPLPLELTFRDEAGRTVRLGDYFGQRPVILTLIQYRCTMLCSQEMQILSQSLRELKFTAGKEFNLLVVSIDARETPELARTYHEHYLREYGRPGAETGWHFLTGDEASIRELADTIGYRFKYDPRTDQFAHPDAVVIATPEGRVARYFFRLEYPAAALRLGLVEAAKGKIGTPLDYVALLCYHYNPSTGKYNLALMGVLRLTAVVFLMVMAVGIAALSAAHRWSRRTARAVSTSER